MPAHMLLGLRCNDHPPGPTYERRGQGRSASVLVHTWCPLDQLAVVAEMWPTFTMFFLSTCGDKEERMVGANNVERKRERGR